MMRVVDFEGWHALEAQDYLQSRQSPEAKWLSNGVCQAMEQHGIGQTAFADDHVLGFAGIIPIWPGRAMAYAYITEYARNNKFIFVHRSVQRFLDDCYIKRIEMAVQCDFEQGNRWARMLGFKLEAERMEHYQPDGEDCALYARVLK